MSGDVVWVATALTGGGLVCILASFGAPILRAAAAERRRECPHRPVLHHPDQTGRLRCDSCGLPAPRR